MRQQGALVASVIIVFIDEDAQESFEHEDFTEGDPMKEITASTGAFNLRSLDDLEEDERIEKVEPNHTFQLPTDPTMPC